MSSARSLGCNLAPSRILSASRYDDHDPLSGVLAYLHGAQRAFSRNREMTALMLQMMTSTDPDVASTIDRMNETNAEMFERLLHGFWPRFPIQAQILGIFLNDDTPAHFGPRAHYEAMLYRVVEITGYTEREIEESSPAFIAAILRGHEADQLAQKEREIRNRAAPGP